MPQRGKGSKKNESPATRVNYEDHSLKFLDWVDSIGLEKTFFGRALHMLEEKLFVRRAAFIFLYCVLLSYTIFYQFDVPYNFTVGDIAKYDVTSPIGFEMTDEVTTEEKRMKAEYAVAVVYDFDTSVFERVSLGLIHSFRTMRNYHREITWPKQPSAYRAKVKEFFQHKKEFETELGVGVSDFMYEWLVDNKFSARIEAILIRNLENWYEQKIAEAPDRFIPAGQTTVVARVVHRNNLGREFSIPRTEVMDIQDPDHFTLDDRKELDRFAEGDRTNILYFGRSLLVPNLTLNKQETASRKQAAREAVIPVNITIKKNQVIVAQGSVIQPFHMAVVKQIETIRSDKRKDLTALAMSLMLSMAIIVFFSYLKRFSQNRVKVDFKDLMVMMLIAFGTILFTKIYLFVIDAAFVSKLGHLLPATFFLYAAPIATGPMLVGLLITSGEIVWLFTAFISLCLGIMVDYNYALMIVSMIGGIAAARGVFNCKTRNDIYFAGIRTGVVNALIVAFVLTMTRFDQEGAGREILFAIPAAFMGGILSSLCAMMFIPLLESVFNYTTDVKLLELSNLNHPLLKDMIVKAPGTYHHSMMVGSMVEAAAEEIGANSLLGKVMCYYHDIGKMEHANYFIENQKPGNNPHDHISPFMSKTLLIAHVKDGVEMGVAFKLGKPIIDGIIQHHGTTLISYFYNKALDLKKEEDPEISDQDFRYPGPKPQFREAALCMLADSIEAAARSLDEPTPARLQNIVRNIVQRKFSDGQLDECNLTLKDISKVEAAFIRILLGIYHQRIDYPRSAGGQLGESIPTTKQG
ncbi:HDIG domain-containing protein [Bdellovibrio sp. SKB1291214]|uniref:HD family phosphohydrolase n=1 Tax=Bdellovibrio sp. SKB1291214 TaxID=1732569 RepID=UPI000B5156F0|nr:HDIG domain-containing metalloprotein [Bdellovibrio sp. SKB1291214]UYL09218.1 HDIG domain-containing protein [Bdellovibrio sp. SKB1291214]